MTLGKEPLVAGLTIPDDDWTDATAEKDGSELLAGVTINGTPMHFEAFAIVEDEGGNLKGATDEVEAALEAWAHACRPDGPWETTTIRGRTYVVFASPYC